MRIISRPIINLINSTRLIWSQLWLVTVILQSEEKDVAITSVVSTLRKVLPPRSFQSGKSVIIYTQNSLRHRWKGVIPKAQTLMLSNIRVVEAKCYYFTMITEFESYRISKIFRSTMKQKILRFSRKTLAHLGVIDIYIYIFHLQYRSRMKYMKTIW